MDEMNHCPFCGGKTVLSPDSSCSGQIVCIGECKFKSAKYWDGPMTSPKEERKSWKEYAAEAWNRRAGDADGNERTE